jgi:hypothetical protein
MKRGIIRDEHRDVDVEDFAVYSGEGNTERAVNEPL